MGLLGGGPQRPRSQNQVVRSKFCLEQEVQEVDKVNVTD
jgi:hypothetical protein